MFIYYVYAESYTMGCDRLDVRKKTDTHTHTHTHTRTHLVVKATMRQKEEIKILLKLLKSTV